MKKGSVIVTMRRVSVLLGAGGNRPRVDLLDCHTGAVTTLLEAPPGESVYAMDIAPHHGSAVFGTKGGSIYIADILAASAESLTPSFRHGAPIRSICFIDANAVAYCDTSDQCLLWGGANASSPFELSTGKHGEVSCLIRCPDGLTGVTRDGKVLCWAIPPVSTPSVRQGLPPARPKALARCVYWKAANAVAYPGVGGRLVLCELAGNGISSIPAYGSDFYAMVELGDDLITIGTGDACLKRWSVGKSEPVDVVEAPANITAAALLPGLKDRLLLVDKEGNARTFALTEGSLIEDGRLSGSDYRVTLGPSSEAVDDYREAMRSAEAERIEDELREKLQNGALEGAGLLLERLDALAPIHVSLSFRAHFASANGDLVQELRYRQELARRLPDAPGAVEELQRFIEVLLHVWQVEEACSVLERVLSISYSDENERLLHDALRYADRLADNSCVIVLNDEAKISFLIECASALGKAFRGTYMINEWEQHPVQCWGTKIRPEALVEKYEANRTTRRGDNLPSVYHQEIAWASHQELGSLEGGVCFSASAQGIDGLELVLRFRDTTPETVVVPVAVFCANHFYNEDLPEVHNQACLQAITDILNGHTAKPWLGHVKTFVTKGLEQLAQSARAERRRKGGV